MKPATTYLERRVSGLLSELPKSETGRNSYGTLWFKWSAPSAELEALWLSVVPGEVVLSCRVAHTHFSRTQYLPKKFTNRQLKRRIARDAVNEAARFLRGEIAVAAEFDQHGVMGSSMWCLKDSLPGALAHSTKLFGPRKYRAWSWSGEVEC
jgi:hypothetical protein